jgi:hypothetical protein
MRPEQVQACYQTRFFGVIGIDDRSEAGMTDVRVVRVHLGVRAGQPWAAPSCIPPLHSSYAGATSLAANW